EDVGSKPVADGKPRDPRILEWLKERGNIDSAIAANPSASVHDDGGREGTGPLRNRRVEAQTHPARASVLNVRKLLASGGNDNEVHDQNGQKGDCAFRKRHRNVGCTNLCRSFSVGKSGIPAARSTECLGS